MAWLGMVWLAAAVVVAVCAAATPASAQIVALVSGEPITTLDVAQRTRLLTLLNQGRTPDRKAVIEELVDERLKLREAKKFDAVPSDSDVDSAFASVAGRARLSPEQFSQMLSAQGSDARSFKSRLRAEIAWSGLVRARYKVVAQVGDKDVAQALTARNQTPPGKVTEYTLRPVVFVVPRGSSEAVYETRRHEAEAFRTKFEGCQEGLAAARGMREVVVRGAIHKTSADLPPALRDLFANTPDGKAVAPERTEAGIELVAVCSRREIGGQTAVQNDVRQELANERLQSQAKRYIAELRRAALIEYR